VRPALSHLPDLEAVGELGRVLRPGGVLLLSNPHPVATGILGARAWCRTPVGERVQIPEWAHPVGAYLDAFRAAGLTAERCLEPPYGPQDGLIAGLPAVIVWRAVQAVRLGKHLAHAGVASRRGAEEIIAAGRGAGRRAGRHGSRARRHGQEAIRVDGQPLTSRRPGRSARSGRSTSPPGVVSTAKDTHGRPWWSTWSAARAGGCIPSAGSTPTRRA
jgi:SAM-dependent methyltransferase